MPLTTLERQHRHRDRIKEKLARLERYEGALRDVADEGSLRGGTWCSYVALVALADHA